MTTPEAVKVAVSRLMASGKRVVTVYLHSKLTVRATRRSFKGKVQKGRQYDVSLTIGRPNYRARKVIAQVKKAGLPFPFVLAVLLMVGLTRSVSAQTPTPISPASTLSFTASADHAAVAEDGQPLVDHYEWAVMAATGGALAFTSSLMKPDPDANSVIRIQPVPGITSFLRGTVYTGTVAAVGAGGVGVSSPSNPFVVPFAPPRAPSAPGAPVVQ